MLGVDSNTVILIFSPRDYVRPPALLLLQIQPSCVWEKEESCVRNVSETKTLESKGRRLIRDKHASQTKPRDDEEDLAVCEVIIPVQIVLSA
jgi:hypothetical protein